MEFNKIFMNSNFKNTNASKKFNTSKPVSVNESQRSEIASAETKSILNKNKTTHGNSNKMHKVSNDTSKKNQQKKKKNLLNSNMQSEHEKPGYKKFLYKQADYELKFSEITKWVNMLNEVIWNWDIVKDRIYFDTIPGKIVKNTFNTNPTTFSDFTDCLISKEKNAVKKNILKALASGKKVWKDSFFIKKPDGKIILTTSRAIFIHNKNGKATHLVGITTDISKLKEMEDKISVQERENEKFFLAAKLSFDVILDWDIITNEMYIGDGFEELFGYFIKNNRGTIEDWSSHLHPDDKESIEKGLQDAINSSANYWQSSYRFIRADNSVANIFDRVSIMRHSDGKAYRIMGAMQDISRQKELEEKLKEEIQLKEMQIAEAREDAIGNERLDLGKELHDNINQLLGASKMYIEMAKRGGEDSKTYLNRSSEYMISAIEEIRRLSQGLTNDTVKNFGLSAAIRHLAEDMMEVNNLEIFCSIDSFEEDHLNDKFKKNIFRIVQEQLNNILKHAKATEVQISLSKSSENIRLIIGDNGIGFDTSKKGKGIGLANIKSRANAYNGTANFFSQPNQGCVLTVKIPF